MAETSDKSAESAEKAYAAAIADAKPVQASQPAAVTPPPAPAPAKAAAPPSASAAKPAKKIRKAAPKKAAAKTKVAKPVAKPAPVPPRARVAKSAARAPKVRQPAPRRASASPKFAVIPTVSELKEKIMATAKTPDFTKPINDAIGEFQTKAKEAYSKSTEALTEATEFAKGNVEAIVETGKILAGGAQDLGKTYVEEAKSAYETLTGDLKEMASVKSPTELFQLQGKIMRRNFDAMVATGSKNTEAMMKLASEAFAPISGRVSVATEKLAKVA
jgi:phasin family protein